MLLRIVPSLFMICALAACQNNGIQVNSNPDQPEIAAGRLHGQRVCGDFTTTGSIFSFTCPALPTKEWTGWQLTPLDVPHLNTSNETIYRTNLFATVDVVTPTSTNLEVLHKGSKLKAVNASPKVLPLSSIGHNGDYTVAVNDDGTRKTWTLTFRVNPCLESSQVDIVNASYDGTSRSNPLIVVFLRAPDQVRDSCGAPLLTGGDPTGGVIGTGSVPLKPPVTTPPPGSCNGQAEKIFIVCEVCVKIPAVSSASGCTFSEALRNYNLPNTGCYVRQVADQNACYGP